MTTKNPASDQPDGHRAWFDERIKGLAAGMSGAEIRAMLRGEPPTERPNPRFLAHTTSLLLHLRPRTYRRAETWFSNTFHLGFFAVFLFAVEILSGLILMIYYVPTPTGAYQSILRLTGSIPYGDLLRDVHRLAGEVMVVVVALHMLRVYLTGSYKKVRRFTWLTGVGLLILTLGLGFSGYLLPWDQLAYWAVTIGTSMAEATPVIGSQLNLLLRGGLEIGGDGLLRFYLLHVIFLPLVMIVLLAAHYYRISRKHSISLPPHIEEGDPPPEIKARALERVSFLPDLLIREMVLIAIGVFVLLAAATFFYDAPLESHADPGLTPLNTEAPWFFLWVQGLLKLGDKTLLGVIVPVLIFALLFAVPYLDFNPHRMPGKRPLALALGVLAVATLLGLSYMGTHHFGIETSPAVRIVQRLAPEEGIGLLHQVPYDQLVVGLYPTGQTEIETLPPELGGVFAAFESQVDAAAKRGELPQVEGVMIVEDWQADLRRVTLRLVWSDEGSESPVTYETFIYLHRLR